MLLSVNTKIELVEDLKRRFTPVECQAEFDDAISIESTIQKDCSELLERFFQSKSDANKFLNAQQQEDLEKDFKNWVLSL